MQQAAVVETVLLHISATCALWSDMLLTSRTCAPSRAAALARGMMIVAVEAAVVVDVVVNAEVAEVLAPAAGSEAADSSDHTRGRVNMIAVLAVMIKAMTYHICRPLLTTSMEFRIVHRLLDVMV